jgi:hypothetical protein
LGARYLFLIARRILFKRKTSALTASMVVAATIFLISFNRAERASKMVKFYINIRLSKNSRGKMPLATSPSSHSGLHIVGSNPARLKLRQKYM